MIFPALLMSDDEKTNILNPPQNRVVDATIVEKNIVPATLLKGNERIPLGSGILVERIGTGGMAAVYKIKHPVLETYYAVKIALPEQQASHGRFVSEARITAKLDHRNIIRIREVGSWNSLPFIEMEFIEGFTLRDILTQKKALPVSIVCAIALNVVKALKYAHTKSVGIGEEIFKGIIHRDLKPENIMISKEGRVVVMDFGLARPIEGSLNSTVTGCFNGTPQYAPPEQLKTEKEKVDQRIDIYAVGVMLYEMLCGVKPFRSFDPRNESLLSYAEERKTTPYVTLQKRKAGIPSRLVKIVDRCIDPDETKRYNIADDLLSDLQAADAATPNRREDKEELLASYISLVSITHTGSPDVSHQKTPPWMLPAVIGIGSIVLGIFVVLLLRTGPRDNLTQEGNDKPGIQQLSAVFRDPAASRKSADDLTFQADNSESPPADPERPVNAGEKNTAGAGSNTRKESEQHVTPAVPENAASVDESPQKPAGEKPAPVPSVAPVVLPDKTDGMEDMIAVAVSAIQQGKFNDALQALGKLPENHPDAAKKTALLLECYVQTGRFTDAQRIADLVGVSSMESDYFIGRIHFAHGTYDKAIDFFNRALLNKPLMPQRRSAFIDETLYYTARSYYQQYHATATENNLIAVREAWQTVKQRFVNKTNDRRYREAVQALTELEK